MAWFLFIDESGHDRVASPYEVLAGVAIQDHELWNVIRELHDAEIRCFGRRYSDGRRELKGSALLKKKVFDHRALIPKWMRIKYRLSLAQPWTMVLKQTFEC